MSTPCPTPGRTIYCSRCGARTWRTDGICRDCELYAPVLRWVRDGLIWRAA